MIDLADRLSSMSNLIIAFSVLFAVLFGAIVSLRILRQQEALRASLRSIDSREFHSAIGDWRLGLEKQLSDINQRLTDTETEFRDVNHLLVDVERAASPLFIPHGVVHSPFLAAMDISPVKVDDNLIFVLTPFEKREAATYAAIVEAFENWNMNVMRGDEEHVTSNILRHIVTLIAKAKVVIANVSSRNPNVMYELGIAHGLGKTVIMVAKSLNNVPFDLSHQRILLYKNRTDLVSKLRDSVGRVFIAKDLRDDQRNPIGLVARTGETCPESGIWQTLSSPPTTAPIAKGNRMPPYNGAAVTWKLIRYS